MKKLVFLSLLSVALLTSCGNGAQKDALMAQNDSLMVELSNRNAELDDIMGAFNEVQEGFRLINEAENRVDLQSGSIRENNADKIKEDIRFISEKLQANREQIAKLEKQLIARLEEYANGANNAGKFIPIPIGMKLEPLNIKLTDSQFFELKKYSALQIAGAFGIKPNQINDYEKSSYANSEMQNISFYIDTELYILKQYEEEINYKLLEPSETAAGKHFKFNENVILRTDAKSQATILTGYVQNGIYTPNEARSFMNKPRMEGGDNLICNGNYIKVADIGKDQEEGGGEGGENRKITKERQKQPI